MKWELPSRYGIGWISSPSLCRSTRSWLSPWWRSSSSLGATQHDEPVVLVGAAGPDLRAVHEPAVLGPRGAGGHRGQIAARIGLAHADRERQLAAADRRQEPLLLRVGPEAVDHRSALAIGDPVVADRRAPPQQLLDDHEPIDGAAIAAPVARRQGHADPPPVGQRLGERRIPVAHPSRGRARTRPAVARTPGTREPPPGAPARRRSTPSARTA